jgi:hypothetical protein
MQGFLRTLHFILLKRSFNKLLHSSMTSGELKKEKPLLNGFAF